MTKSAKGTADKPGKNVKAKAGSNRVIRDTGWGRFQGMLEYKAVHFGKVKAAYTSQKCSRCGHTEKDNRKTQTSFKCIACGFESNADINAALNILASGVGASGRGEALASATSVSRQVIPENKGLHPSGC